MREKALIIFDRITEYCLYGLILFIPISAAATEIFTGWAILSFIIKKMIKPEFGFIKKLPNLFLLFFIIFCGLSLFNSGPFLKISVRALFAKWLEYIFIFLAAGDTLADSKRLRNAVTILLVMGAVVGIDVLFQQFLGIEFLRHRPLVFKKIMRIHIITGPFKHYNDLATYLVCILPLAVSLFLIKAKKKIYYVVLFLMVALLSLCLLFTFSRGGWLGFMAAALLMLFLSRLNRRVLIIVGIFILLITLMPKARERVAYTFKTAYFQKAASQKKKRYVGDANRFLYWDTAFAMIKENPFLGQGVGTYMAQSSHYTPKKRKIPYAHNCYLQIWAETGIFALLSFLLFLGSILYKAIKAFRGSCFKVQSPKDGSSGKISFAGNPYLLLGVICAIFGFLVHSFFDTQLYSLQLSVLFWVMLGMMLTAADPINLSKEK
ncbi:O-antigen ligase family protein [Candidatus Omnitrophota bacterium]